MAEIHKKVYEKKNKFISIVISVYVCMIGFCLPLVIRNKYFDIMVFKYYYYCFCTIVMVILLAGYFLKVYLNKKDTEVELSFGSILKALNRTDYLILIFFFIATVSTISSDYLYESFWGNEGRFTGLFLYIWYLTAYFCVSKLWKFKSWYIDLIILSGVIVCIFGITDYFRMDIFKFKLEMVEKQKDIFVSTIGNINMYTSYVGMIVALATVLFSLTKQWKKAILYYFSMTIGFFAIIMGNSDNAYLSLGALFVFLPLLLFTNINGIKRYIIIIATFFSVIEIIGWINTNFSGTIMGIDSSYNLIIGFKWFPILLTLMWLIVGIWYIVDYFKKNKTIQIGKMPQRIWLLFILLIFLAIVYGVFDCTIAGNSKKYGNFASYLLFNDDWGTHRGYIWRNALECFEKFSIWKKLVGYGPETFGILLLRKTAGNPYGQLFDSAHNEYLHLLITIGILGVLSYIAFVIELVKSSIKENKDNIYKMAIAFAIICYSSQAFVNINVPIVAPVLWLLFGAISAKTGERD
jgi:hypothetical protein